MEEKIKMIKVKRTNKEEVKKEDKIRKIKVKRIKNEIEKPENFRKIKVINFKAEYEYFLSLGKAPDEYIENLSNEIAVLYFYAKNIDIDGPLLKAKLKETEYKKFMKLFVDMSTGKMHAMGIYKKMHNTAVLLLNLLTMIHIDKDQKIKLPVSLIEFRNNIEMKRIFHRSPKLDYKIEVLKRMFIIKDNRIIGTDDEILTSDELKGTNIMIEYQKGKFISIPYRYYKKLNEIDTSYMEYFIVIDVENGMMAKDSVNSDKYLKLTLDEIVDKEDNMVYYSDSINSHSFISLLRNIINYEDFWQALDIYNNITEQGVYSTRELLELRFNDGTKKTYDNYDKFITEYMPFIRL